MADTREIMTEWLRDAHAMESAAVNNFETQVDHLDGFPDLKSEFTQQLELSKANAQRIDDQLHAMGEDSSALKDLGTRMAGKLQAWTAGASPDEVVKQAVTTLAYEQWEIANFRALAAAAAHEGESGLVSLFEGMADQKFQAAQWLATRIPDITRRYLDMQRAH
jgi:ferritin-like metal-binding protein YciE